MPVPTVIKSEFSGWMPTALSYGEEQLKAALVRAVMMTICGIITFLASAIGYNSYLTWRLAIVLAVLTAFNIRALNTFIIGGVLGCLGYIAMYRTVASLWSYVESLVSPATLISRPLWWPW